MRQSETGRGCPEVPGRGGGNGQEILGGVVDQQGEDEMREQPAPRERLARRRQSAEAEQAFEPLEGELDSVDSRPKPSRLLSRLKASSIAWMQMTSPGAVRA